MPWFVQAFETTICLPKRELSEKYEDHEILIRPATEECYADVSIEFEHYSEVLKYRKLIYRFFNALAWVYSRPIYEKGTFGGTTRGRVRKNYIDHAIGELDLYGIPEVESQEDKALALSLYRKALCVDSITATSIELFRIFEIRLGQGSGNIRNKNLEELHLEDLEAKRRLNELLGEKPGLDVGEYLYITARNSSAHAAYDPNDPYNPEHNERLIQDLCLIWYLAEKFMEIEIDIPNQFEQRPIPCSTYAYFKLSGMLDK
jgi:hypothetical protein